MARVVTRDKSWLQDDQPETKSKSKKWRYPLTALGRKGYADPFWGSEWGNFKGLLSQVPHIQNHLKPAIRIKKRGSLVRVLFCKRIMHGTYCVVTTATIQDLCTRTDEPRRKKFMLIVNIALV